MSELTSNNSDYADAAGAVVTETLDGTITGWNEAAARIFGYSAAEAIGRNIAILYPADRFWEQEDIAQKLLAGEDIAAFETVCCHKDRSEIHVSLSVAPILDREGRLIGTTTTAWDISQKKHAEASEAARRNELAHVGRLSAMGEMSAAIAHELNQPLTAVTNYVKAAQRFLDADPPSSAQIRNARDAMEKAADQTIRAGTIIRYLRDFVEKRESEKTPENINQVIREAVALGLVGTAHRNVKVKFDLGARIPRIFIDKIQIQQVLLNLIRNAMEAMEGHERRERFISSALIEPRYVELVIRDTGPGFSPEIADRLFHAFATTKEDGLGIGLKICQSLVEAHGGSIKALPGGPGAAFQVRLPLS